MKFMSIVMVLAMLSYGIPIDPLLAKHAIYATTKIQNTYACKTPLNGIVGTNGVWNNIGNLVTIQTHARATNIAGSNWTITSGDTLFYVNGSGATYSLAVGADTNKVTAVYPVLPVFPDLSGVIFNGTANISAPGTYNPGQYNSLNPDWTVNLTTPIYLKAGIYHFKSLNIGASKKVVIMPNNGSYKTEIYVSTTTNIGDQSKLCVNDSTGYGQVILAQISSSDMTFTSLCEVTATVIAKDATVKFNSNSKLFGQVFANIVELIDFNGGAGIIYTEIKTKRPVIVSDTITCQESGSVINTPKVNFIE